MRRRFAVVTSGVLVSLGLVAGCGGRGIPRTQANLAVCAKLAAVLDNRAPMIDLTGATLMSNEPITHKLRQDIATYIAEATQEMPGASHAAATAEADCSSINAPLAKAYGGS
ncbi:MAG TPA: hypothetical protein VMR14_12405 [Streptosporangiaceae bacterium]|jgi:hypothetical protein|nr:hypothetical protein [Streptosporangiaceae bacterium]